MINGAEKHATPAARVVVGKTARAQSPSAAAERQTSNCAQTAKSGCRARATAELLRELLSRQGGSESHSDAQEGFYLTLESPGEVTVQYNVNERENGLARRERMKRNEIALLELCLALVRNGGHALTFFASPRTLALYVRTEETNAAPH